MRPPVLRPALSTALLLLTLAGLAGGCVSRSAKLPPPRVYGDIDRSFDQKRFTAEVGDGVRVNLATPGTPGCAWRVVGNNPYVLPQLTEPAYRPADPAHPEAGGTTVVTFQATNLGWSVLRLAYAPAGNEVTVAKENAFTVTVHVVPPGTAAK